MAGRGQRLKSYSDYRPPKLDLFREHEAAKLYYRRRGLEFPGKTPSALQEAANSHNRSVSAFADSKDRASSHSAFSSAFTALPPAITNDAPLTTSTSDSRSIPAGNDTVDSTCASGIEHWVGSNSGTYETPIKIVPLSTDGRRKPFDLPVNETLRNAGDEAVPIARNLGDDTGSVLRNTGDDARPIQRSHSTEDGRSNASDSESCLDGSVCDSGIETSLKNPVGTDENLETTMTTPTTLHEQPSPEQEEATPETSKKTVPSFRHSPLMSELKALQGLPSTLIEEDKRTQAIYDEMRRNVERYCAEEEEEDEGLHLADREETDVGRMMENIGLSIQAMRSKEADRRSAAIKRFENVP